MEFLCDSQMSAPFKCYLSNERPFSEKREALIRGTRSLKFSRQKGGARGGGGGANSRERLFRVNTVIS